MKKELLVTGTSPMLLKFCSSATFAQTSAAADETALPRPSATGLVPPRFSPEESQTKTGGDAQTEERRDRGRPAAAEP